MRELTAEAGIRLFDVDDPRQGIVHVIGPEQGYTQPGMTIVCGDSHTSTHGAFGAIAFGIGTSEVEMVLASQCLLQSRPKTMKIQIDGELQKGVFAKDIILYIISKISEHMNEMKSVSDKMLQARKKANQIEDMEERALAYCDDVKVHFDKIRYHVDKLELLIDDEEWRLPKFREMLFTR